MGLVRLYDQVRLSWATCRACSGFVWVIMCDAGCLSKRVEPTVLRGKGVLVWSQEMRTLKTEALQVLARKARVRGLCDSFGLSMILNKLKCV